MFKLKSVCTKHVGGACAAFLCLFISGTISAQMRPAPSAGGSSETVRAAAVEEARQLEFLYRTDMDSRRYPQAHEHAISLTASQPSNALAWYRRARAASFSNQWPDARLSLNKAQELDPKFKFSADPLRVKALDKMIEFELAERLPTPGAAVIEPVSIVRTSTLTTVATASTPTELNTPLSMPATTATRAVPTEIKSAPVSTVAQVIQPTSTSDLSQLRPDVPLWIYQFGGLAAITVVISNLMALGIAAGNRREIRNARGEFTDYVSGLRAIYDKQAHIHKLADVFEGMTRSQRELHLLRQLMLNDSLEDTAIYDAIETFLPVLERNIGLAALQELEIKGINAGASSAAEIGQKLFQMHNTGRFTIAVSPTANSATV